MRNEYNKINGKQHLLLQKSNGSDQKEMSLDLMADWTTIIKTTIIIKYQIKLFINNKQVSHNSLYFKEKSSWEMNIMKENE